MNRHYLILPASIVILSACGGGGSFSTGGYDPLDAAGGAGANVGVVDTGLRPGSFVKVSVAEAPFFKRKPSGPGSADKMLPAGTSMKVISAEGSYVKGELESGEVGYVLAVQVIDENAGATTVVPLPDNVQQVWPPVDGTLPYADPSMPSGPTIPEVIDPDAPEPEIPEIPALPDDAPTPGLGSEPPLPEPVDVTPDKPEVESEGE